MPKASSPAGHDDCISDSGPPEESRGALDSKERSTERRLPASAELSLFPGAPTGSSLDKGCGNRLETTSPSLQPLPTPNRPSPHSLPELPRSLTRDADQLRPG